MSISYSEENGLSKHANFMIRPYTFTFLKKISQYYNIVIFSDQEEEFTDSILDQIDSSNTLITQRFYKQHLVEVSANRYAKDLSTVLNHGLESIVQVDSHQEYCIGQLANCVPLLPFVGR